MALKGRPCLAPAMAVVAGKWSGPTAPPQLDGADVIFTGSQQTDEGEVLHRIAYELLFDVGEIHQVWEYSTDGGRQWNVFFAAWYLPEQ